MTPGEIFNPWKLFVGLFIPNVLARFPGLSPGAKLVYGRLAQYAGKDGNCFPKQSTLAEETGLSERHVGRMIGELEDQGFIRADRPTGRNRLQHGHTQYVFLWHKIFVEECRSGPDILSGPSKTKCPVVYKEVEENHNKENHKAVARTKKPFAPPSLPDIQSYCQERKNSIDPICFFEHYNSNGWKVGRNPMRDWKAAVHTWERRDNKEKPNVRRRDSSRISAEPGKYDAVPVHVFDNSPH